MNLDSFGPLVILAFPFPSQIATISGRPTWSCLWKRRLIPSSPFCAWETQCVHCPMSTQEDNGCPMKLWVFTWWVSQGSHSQKKIIVFVSTCKQVRPTPEFLSRLRWLTPFWRNWDHVLRSDNLFPSEVLLWGFLQATAWGCYPPPHRFMKVYSSASWPRLKPGPSVMELHGRQSLTKRMLVFQRFMESDLDAKNTGDARKI